MSISNRAFDEAIEFLQGFVKEVEDSSAALLLNNPAVAPYERRAGKIGLGFSGREDRSRSRERVFRSRSRSRSRGRDSYHRDERRRDGKHDRDRRERSIERDRRERSRETDRRDRSRDRDRNRDRGLGNKGDRTKDGREQANNKDPSGASHAPAGAAALSIAEKMRAKAAAMGKQSIGKMSNEDETRRAFLDVAKVALQATISKDDTKRGGGWEQFDLNKMNYEQETRGGVLSAQRQAVLAAIEGDSMCITDKIAVSEYHQHSKNVGASADDERHMATMFGSAATILSRTNCPSPRNSRGAASRNPHSERERDDVGGGVSPSAAASRACPALKSSPPLASPAAMALATQLQLVSRSFALSLSLSFSLSLSIYLYPKGILVGKD